MFLDSDLVFDWDAANRDHIACHEVLPEEAEQVINLWRTKSVFLIS